MKASNVVAPKKGAKEKPDLEEALDESDEEKVINEIKEDDEDVDLSKDKYVKQPKKRAAPKKGAAAKPKGKGKRKAVDDDDDEISSEDAVKSKGKANGKANGKAKGKAATKGRK